MTAAEDDAGQSAVRSGGAAPEDVPVIADLGQPADTIVIAIDYAIIQHFSQHLYGSPNKAVEELVANGFDALARMVDVWVPGPQVDDSVLVWDDGQSMGVDGLKSLWEIARSPKSRVPNRQVTGTVDGHTITRDMIGKFGIGKLASYAVGDRITHFCRSQDGYLVASVYYVDVLDEQRGREAYTTPVRRLTEEQAREAVTALFVSPPPNLDQLLARPTWTLAQISSLREDVDLKPGRLSWVIGNGMPLRPDFGVRVNNEPVTAKLSKNAKETWDLSTVSMTRAIASVWHDAVRDGDASGVLEIGPSMSGCLPALRKGVGESAGAVRTSDEISDTVVRFPHLGDVRVTVRLYADSLLAKKDEDRPRTHGFFVMVRGRLVNSEDELLFLKDPSFTSFYRTQFVIQADGLDEDLLADRERLKRSSLASQELALLQKALNSAARSYFEKQDPVDAQKASAVSLLPLDNRELYRQPLTALLLARDELGADGADFSDPQVRRVNATENNVLSDLDAVQGDFLVNQDHPLFAAVRAEAGGGGAAQRFLRVFDVFAVGERLLEGHLYDMGLSPEQVANVSQWRDRLLRALATRYSLAGEEVLAEVHNASHKGDAPFEKALAKLFRLMGFDASRDGASGAKDVLTVAPVGPDHYTFTVEAKGSQGPVENVPAAIAGGASHRDKVKADHALVVAREFAGFKRPRKEGVAILDECTSVGRVSIITLDVLVDLYRAVQDFSYPLSVLLPVLQVVESPDDKKARVAKLVDPLTSFDFSGALDQIWQEQRGRAAKDVVSYRPLWQAGGQALPLKEYETKLLALDSLSGGLVVVNTTNETAYLRQSPELITARIVKALATQTARATDDADARKSDRSVAG